MKSKLFKILGVTITLGLVLSFASAALPVAASPGETINEWYKFGYPKEGADGNWFYSPDIYRVGEITEAINGDLYVHVGIYEDSDHIFKSTDGGRTWADTGYHKVEVCDSYSPGWVFDMVCSSIDEDIVYATDGYYVYKTADGGDTWDYVARDSLEEELGGDCGCCLTYCVDGPPPITSIDVTYDADDNPFVFIGTRAHDVYIANGCDECYNPEGGFPGDVLYIGEGGYPANWLSMNLSCFHGGGYDAIAVGCAPDWADTKETYAVVTTDYDLGDEEPHTWVVYTSGTICGWYEFAELLPNCDPDYNFESLFASRIGFPDDWEDTETLFVGVVDYDPCTDCEACNGDDWCGCGGDVYMATDGWSIDLNLAGITSGCEGIAPVDIISLDVCGDTDEAALIAGAFCDTNVYYSTDGGWSWDESEKDPTGDMLTYVIWYGDCAEGALAATMGCEAAVSMSCGEEVGEFWNQISLIATEIEVVRSLGFSPGYVCEDSETMFMVSQWRDDPCDYEDASLWRYDGTYWERVYLGFYDTAWNLPDSHIDWVFVSPDFNTTNTLYAASHKFGVWRSTDAGCSWKLVAFPCAPRPWISAAVVIDEDTVIAGGRWGPTPEAEDGRGYVYKTTRHGARPWKEYEYNATDPGNVVSFALEPGYEDPGTVLLGDDDSQVFISEDGGEEWDLVGDCAAVLDPEDDDYETWVIFDPAYPTNPFIYAASYNIIARCEVDFDEDWADQTWEVIYDGLNVAAGIAAAGDTALYVTDTDLVYYDVVIEYGGVLRSLNPDTDDADDVVFERLGPGLEHESAELHDLWLTCDTSEGGCPENVLWSLDWHDEEDVWVWEDTLAAPVVLNLPVDGQKLATTDSATLSWKVLCGADCYEVDLWRYCAECPDEKLTVDISDLMDCHLCDIHEEYECFEDDCIVVDGLEPGCTYFWQVRVCIGEPYLSKWSEKRTFTTALLPVPFRDLCSPACGAQDIILTPNFAWGAVSGATGYDVELATTETFTVGCVKGKTTINAWVPTVTLEYATTYYWRVRAFKDGVYSGWTYCMFTTMAEPVPPPPPVVIEQVPPAAPPVINIPPAEMITPTWIYAIIGVGAALAIVVIVLIVRTRRPPPA